ncbi:hypothetical protein D9M68_709680 [compost metagenome]
MSQRAQSIGVRVRDTSNEITMATARVMENSRNRRSTIPPMNRIERNTATSDRFIESKVKPTSRAPLNAASIGVSPASICREMFSSTTMASSTTRPVAMISAISDRLFSEKPSRYMAAKVPTSDTGTASDGISAARQRPRKANTTRITRATAIIKVRSASCKVARITGERSIATSRSTLAGITARNAGNCSRMLAMVSMIFAPVCRLITSSTACSSL